MKIKRTIGAGIALCTSLTGSAAALSIAGPADAATPPAPYEASAASDIVKLSAALAGRSAVTTKVGDSTATANSSRGSGETDASGSNLAATLAGRGLPKDGVSVAAAPSRTADGGPSDGSVPGVLTLGGVKSSATAHYTSDKSCPALTSGNTRLLSTGSVQLAAATVGPDVPGIGTIAKVGASRTVSRTDIVGRSVRARTTTTVGDITLLGGQVVVHVVSPVTATATSDGSKGTTSVSNPTVTVKVGSAPPVNVKDLPGGAVTLPAALAPLASLKLTLLKPTDSSSGALGEVTVPAVLQVDVKAGNVAGASLANVSLGVGPAKANAKAPAGGLDCAAVTDSDGDGLTDAREAALGTSPTTKDSDGDGLSDGAEVNTYKTNPKDSDTDNDGLSDGQEIRTYKTSPTKADTDGDGLSDGSEVKTYKTNPRKSDTDGDGLKDGAEVKGTKETYTVRTASGTKKLTKTVRTDPRKADSDGDGIKDGAEVKGTRQTIRYKKKGLWHSTTKTVKTDPTNPDTDGDGLKDGAEVKGSQNTVSHRKTDPTDYDTDRGGRTDGAEVKGKTDPTVAGTGR